MIHACVMSSQEQEKIRKLIESALITAFFGSGYAEIWILRIALLWTWIRSFRVLVITLGSGLL